MHWGPFVLLRHVGINTEEMTPRQQATLTPDDFETQATPEEPLGEETFRALVKTIL